jgi:hypothetical protein
MTDPEDQRATIELAPAARSEPTSGAVTAPATRPRRRRTGVIAGVVVLVLLVVAVVAALVGENTARGAIRDQIRDRIIDAFALDAATEVDVDVDFARPALVQVVGGRLDAVRIEIPELTAAGLTGSAEIAAAGLPTAGGAVDELRIRYAIGSDQIAGAADRLTGAEVDSITLDEPQIVVAAGFSVLGFRVPVTVGLLPSVESGAIAFTPERITVGDDAFTADQLRSNPVFGGLAGGLLRPQSFCVAENLPAFLTIDDVAVDGDELVLRMTGDGAVLADAARPGSCAPAS